MATRTPVVLVALPNVSYMLGTFDTAHYKKWWRSRAFPDNISFIKKGMHIYGRTHLAIAKRVDGRWAVYRSKNYGIDWELAWLAASGEVIYDIVMVAFGWAIMNTSEGFYETVKAGATWTKIADLPAGTNCAFCNIGGGDVLLCTDGHLIWRSIDIARSWTQVFDMRTVSPGDIYPEYTGQSIPCIAGAGGRALAGHGPWMCKSNDDGHTWSTFHSWDQCNVDDPEAYAYDNDLGTYHLCFPPPAVIHNRRDGFLISEIVVASIDGPTGDDVTFVVKTKDIKPVYELIHDQIYQLNGKYYTRLFKTYSGHTPSGEEYGNFWFRYILQRPLSTSDDQVSAYDLPVTGSSERDTLIFSAQAGDGVPSLCLYTDVSMTDAISIDVESIQIYDSADMEDLPTYGGEFLDDNYVTNTWVYGGCDNHGYWGTGEGYRRQNLSFEADMDMDSQKEKLQNLDTIIDTTSQADHQADIQIVKPIPVILPVDALLDGQATTILQCDRHLEGSVTKDQSIDQILSADKLPVLDIDGVFESRVRNRLYVDMGIRRIVPISHRCDIIILENDLPERLTKMDRKFPQVFDIMVPDVGYGVYNSKKESV
jgi:hypothetical protein